MSAARALIEMSAERGGATPRNRQEHFDVLPGDPLTASFDEGVSAARTRSATSRGGRSIYSSCGGRPFSSSESRGLPVALR